MHIHSGMSVPVNLCGVLIGGVTLACLGKCATVHVNGSSVQISLDGLLRRGATPVGPELVWCSLHSYMDCMFVWQNALISVSGDCTVVEH